MDLTNTQNIISKLKEVKKQNELTLPRILDMIEANGDYLSMTTLRRVFAANSEQEDSFNYDKTIRPIANVLLLQEEYAPEGTVSTTENEALKAVLKLKNEEIESLKKQIEIMRKMYEERIDFLIDQIRKKDKRMDEKDEIINRLMAKVL